MASESGEGSCFCGSKKTVKYKSEMAKFMMARWSNRPSLKFQTFKSTRTKQKKQIHSSYQPASSKPHNDAVGCTVDIADLLFTPERDFLIRNNGLKVRADDLWGKTVLLYILPLNEKVWFRPGDISDMIEAYHELLPMGGIEFVTVPVQLPDEYDPYHRRSNRPPRCQENFFHQLFSIMPWPAVPYSDKTACGDRIVRLFEVDHPGLTFISMPYWVIIDSTNTVVASRAQYYSLFNFCCGAELFPLTAQRISALWGDCYKPRKHLNNLDQLLSSPTRDFLLSSSGDKVPISSLKGKVIGLYLCDNRPHPPRMEVTKKVYQDAKLRGFDFEIVQINFHFHIFNRIYVRDNDLSVQPCRDNISWLTLPFKDPSCRKLQRIFKREPDESIDYWEGDCLVIVDQRQADVGGVLFEFSGAEIFEKYGIEGYPFTRQSLVEIEYRIQKEEVKLQLLFPPGDHRLFRPVGDVSELFDGSQLLGRRVLVLFAAPPRCKSVKFVSMLKSRYLKRLHNDAEENNFEVVYVPCDEHDTSFSDMPWLVRSYSVGFTQEWMKKIFKRFLEVGLVAFDVDGELMAKDSLFDYHVEKMGYDKLPFPFISQDLRREILNDVDDMCNLEKYHRDDDSDED